MANYSIVDYLNSIGKNSSYGARSGLAAQNGIKNYMGTSQQNTQLLNTLRASQTKAVAPKVVAVKPVVKPAAPAQSNLNTLTNQYLGQANTDVNKLYDQQKATQLAQLKAQNDKAIAGINQQKKDTSTAYYGERNQADVVSTQNVQRLRELMGAQGLQGSGENITASTSLNNERQNVLNTLNTQEQSQMNDYANQINDINDPSKQQAITSQVEADRSKALIDAKNQAQEKAWRQYSYTNMSASEKAQLDWAKKQYGEDAAWRMYELKYNGEITKSTNQATINAYAP